MEERRSYDRRQATRSGRRATDPHRESVIGWPSALGSEGLAPMDEALVVTRRDIAMQARQLASLQAEVEQLGAAVRRLTDAVQVLTARQPRNP